MAGKKFEKPVVAGQTVRYSAKIAKIRRGMSRREVINQGFLEDLEAAHICAQRALNALYDEYGPKRSLWYRLQLGRAQSILISLHQQELKRQKEERE